MGTKVMFNAPVNSATNLAENFPDATYVDIYESQLKELDRINNPTGNVQSPSDPPAPSYVYYPWKNTILKTLDQDNLFKIRTNRNKNLITALEQEALDTSVVGVAGMSVGAGIAIALSYSGIANHIKIADNDVLDTSNLNRLRETLLSVGQQKTSLAAEHIYEINPYANVEIFDQGITKDTIDAFFKEPKLALVIDEIDDFKMKVLLRLKAKEYRVPLIMFTSLGDNILVDIERYDLDGELPLFHGLLEGVSEEILSNPLISQQDIRKYSVQLVGAEYIPTKALASVLEMGSTLVGRPQLYSTIAVDGGLAAYVVRKLILDDDPKSGRYFIQFNTLFSLPELDFGQEGERDAILKGLFSGGK